LIRPRIGRFDELIGALVASPGDYTGGRTSHRNKGE
jgi:hypothetical protein